MIERSARLRREQRRALYSECGLYRYALEIVWLPGRARVQWIGLNPSTATELEDDATIRRCKGYAGSWGYGGVVMTNLCAFRSKDPNEMLSAEDPVGPENTPEFLAGAGGPGALIVAAWGAHAAHPRLQPVAAAVLERIPRLQALRLTQGGHPHHPLRLPKRLNPTPLAQLQRTA